ncbi:response regulator transcription factor [Vibrio parahaemolyticus]|nr:response regulator transcription factor [Vibrio parahaemolyticus]
MLGKNVVQCEQAKALPLKILVIKKEGATLTRMLQAMSSSESRWEWDRVSNAEPSQWQCCDAVVAEAPLAPQLTRWLRIKFVPVLVLSRTASVMAKVAYLDAGAKDCLTLPFRTDELSARLRALTRSMAPQARELRDGALVMDLFRLQVFLKRQSIKMTNMEFSLLHYFLTHPNKVCHRNELLMHVWGKRCDIPTRTVDTHVSQLRYKLGFHCIENAHGIGCRYHPQSESIWNKQ